MTTVDETLGQFPADAITNKVLRSIYKVVPYSPNFGHYSSIDDAVRALDLTASDATIARARAIAGDSEQVADLMWMANLLDAGDKGYAIATGLWSAVKLFRGGGMGALETDTQQRNDAVLKGLGLAYMLHKAFPGGVQAKVDGLRKTPAGQALAVYYATVEIALPFADNATLAGGQVVGNLYQKHGAAQLNKLTALAGQHDLGGTRETLEAITEPVSKVVDLARGYIRPVADAAAPYLPSTQGAADGADRLAGIVANAADVLPVYRVLGARMAAEHAARQALQGG